jgi:hypothetical protein
MFVFDEVGNTIEGEGRSSFPRAASTRRSTA